jgi:maltooligosyltrehalose synthase
MSASKTLKIGDIVKVQPMHYCLSFVSGGIEIIDSPEAPKLLTHHWTDDGFRARILDRVSLRRQFEGQMEEEEYLQIKIYGQGRKHFTKRNNEKTKVVWIQERLVSICRDNEKKKENKKK